MGELAASFAAFAAYFTVALSMTVIFGWVYAASTPHNELRLVREGNAAAALGFCGAVLGFVLPLALVISVSHRLIDTVAWGAVALLVQVVGHAASRLLLPTLTADIAAGKVSAAIVQSGIGLTLGVLQAACWTP